MLKKVRLINEHLSVQIEYRNFNPSFLPVKNRNYVDFVPCFLSVSHILFIFACIFSPLKNYIQNFLARADMISSPLLIIINTKYNILQPEPF